MVAKAIGFAGRGESRHIGTPFDRKSEVCRTCGGCSYVCPACQLRCTFTEPDKAICGGCANIPGVADVIASRVGIPAERGDPLGQMKISTRALAQGVKKDATARLTACGLALRSFD